MDYRRRVVDDTLDEMFPHLAAIALEGAKGVGKSATAGERAATVVNLADPRRRAAVELDWDYVTTVRPPVLVDEWQLYPPVWDRVKKAVDEDSSGGRYLLAGSANVAPGTRIHSGAGRIISLRMRPLSVAERGLIDPTVSFAELLAGGRPTVRGQSSVTPGDYVDEILASGFPGIRELPARLRAQQLDGYLARIVERELPENGVEVRRPAALRRWLAAYGAATSSTATYTTILDAATPGESDKISRATADSYRNHLERIFVVDPVEAWIPVFNPLKKLGSSPKHHLVDPALAARIAGVDRAGLLSGDGHVLAGGAATWLGALFESLVTQSVRVYADAAFARVGHLRTRDSNYPREVDLVVEGDDRRVVGIEVKLAPVVTDRDVRHLLWLRDQLGDRVADLVVVTTGDIAYRRADGIAVVPLALLGP
ncbi:ATPase (AAA+ superfamily)-like protein [Xylanimonas cellulosilytica DSM 15894]|uniref:ATPase (AAA+ superfamily)-like protein n=1 Tax=Xylanimonas cellulosilytica (strain DSM 15894 / JCM 12276 / CECT 5975 / KCTC 9989 / LMG 20990 / NBRC 107835 / XIL07) TaxID=446471 RepID=D1BZ27_XYLCX|nr:DUF4143 domain-containing protein [Xylanimonas cellulosilytica]ACZ31924.1 ATPase (AAA+ superfamily)-like protein [Xylanimonas cellulosilytica DSM 15894]